jgi:hypothetical protein
VDMVQCEKHVEGQNAFFKADDLFWEGDIFHISENSDPGDRISNRIILRHRLRDNMRVVASFTYLPRYDKM